jgi:hypothetical protein
MFPNWIPVMNGLKFTFSLADCIDWEILAAMASRTALDPENSMTRRLLDRSRWAYRWLWLVALLVLLLRTGWFLASRARASAQTAATAQAPVTAGAPATPVQQAGNPAPAGPAKPEFPAQSPAQSPAEPAKKNEEFDKAKEDAKSYLEWVIGIAGFFTIAQTLAAGFAAQSFSADAEKRLKEIDALKVETRKELEAFNEKHRNAILAEDARIKSIRSLRHVYEQGVLTESGVPGAATQKQIDWLDLRYNLFGKMDVIERQRLLSIDRYLGFDLQLESMKDDLERANTLRVMANFYISKFEYESKLHMAHWPDLQRAEYFLRLWIRHSPGRYQFRNDLGLVFCMYAAQYHKLKDFALERKYRLLAKREHEIAAEIQPEQQRAYYNLAVIERDLSKIPDTASAASATSLHLKEALRLYGLAAQHKNWEEVPEPDLNADILYNTACCEALLAISGTAATRPLDATIVDPILARLDGLATQGLIRKSVVEGDFVDKDALHPEKDGDFSEFKTLLSPADTQRLLALVPKLTSGQRRIA